MRPIFLFDLDDTTVCSHQRQGDTLEDWRRMSTPANVMKDTMLPLADDMVNAMAEGLDVGILTSRVLGHADKVWLNIHGMLADTIYSRSPEDNRECGEFKLAKMYSMAVDRRVALEELKNRVILFDDNSDVQLTLRNAGFRVICPIEYNNKRTQKKAV
jgi:FMN phosphatase YigB (HAD superfamily)